MRYILISIAGIMCCLVAISSLNQYTFRMYFAGRHPGNPSLVFGPDKSEYLKNFYVATDVKENAGNYEFSFKFRDQNQKEWTWHWSYPEDVTDEMTSSFGVPKSVFQPYYPSDTATRHRMDIIHNGQFEMEDNQIGPDLNQMINTYRPFLDPISQLVTQAMGGVDSWRARAELVIKFVQDIPYCVPPDDQGGRYTAGIFPPPQVFLNMYGDCDSKVVLYASLLSYFDNYEILILKETGHILTGLKGIPKPYDKFIEYHNNQYIMAETAGPGRTNLGVITDPYQKINETILVKID